MRIGIIIIGGDDNKFIHIFFSYCFFGISRVYIYKYVCLHVRFYGFTFTGGVLERIAMDFQRTYL